MLWVVIAKPKVWWWSLGLELGEKTRVEKRWCPFFVMNFLLIFLVVPWPNSKICFQELETRGLDRRCEVLVYGGDETRPLVRLVCCLPSAWVNLFLFVDSPYKRRAARKISFWCLKRGCFDEILGRLDMRFVLEVLLMPVFLMLAIFDELRNSPEQAQGLSFFLVLFDFTCVFLGLPYNLPSLTTLLPLSVVLYLLLRGWMSCTVVRHVSFRSSDVWRLEVIYRS